ncbi:hypothetical protein ABE79_14190, partial [Proteus mirabilis]
MHFDNINFTQTIAFVAQIIKIRFLPDKKFTSWLLQKIVICHKVVRFRPQKTSELLFALEEKPPLPQTLFAACQHLLAMFVAVITPAILICQALGLPTHDTQRIISMSLFASGIASLIQIRAWGPVGSGLLSIQGTSFNFVAPLIM